MRGTFTRKLTKVYKGSKVLGKVSNQTIIEFSQKHYYFLESFKVNRRKEQVYSRHEEIKGNLHKIDGC